MLTIGADILLEVLPFAVVMEKSGAVSHIGNSLHKCTSMTIGSMLAQEFRVLRPAQVSLDFLSLIKPRKSGMVLAHQTGIEFQAQCYPMPDRDKVLLVCTPRVSDLEALTKAGLSIRDFPAWERTIDYVLMMQAREAERSSRESATELASLKSKLAESSKSIAMEAIRVSRELKALLHARTLFLRIISHELRNPMHVISGCISLIEESSSAPPPDQISSPLRLLRVHAGKIVRLIEQATALLGAMAPDLRLDLQPVSLKAVVYRYFSVEAFTDDSNERGNIEIECDDKMGRVYLDYELMDQALTCLREIADEARSLEEKVKVRLYLDEDLSPCVELSGNLRISIDDDYIFNDPLKMVSSGLSRGDVGMGLNVALIRKIMLLHSGEMLARISQDNLSRLLLRFPAAPTSGISSANTSMN